MSARLRTVVTLLLALAASQSHSASAAVIEPGGRPSGYGDAIDYWKDVGIEWLENWRGEVLASQTTPFEIRVFSEEAGRDVSVSGGLVHEVIREADTGYLSFHYRANASSPSPDTRDFEGITVGGFGPYRTDVWADVGTSDLPTLYRTEDGNSIWYTAGEDFGHWLIVRTNATDFAPGGHFSYSVDWDGWGVWGDADIATFKPVPEPTTGLAVLTAGGALLWRRRPSAVVPLPAAGR